MLQRSNPPMLRNMMSAQGKAFLLNPAVVLL